MRHWFNLADSRDSLLRFQELYYYYFQKLWVRPSVKSAAILQLLGISIHINNPGTHPWYPTLYG
jgi:hypothetical protein